MHHLLVHSKEIIKLCPVLVVFLTNPEYLKGDGTLSSKLQKNSNDSKSWRDYLQCWIYM